MVEVINYIFGSLQASSDAIKRMKKILRNQARFNRTLTAFAFTITTYALMAEIHNYRQTKKIEEELGNKIEELRDEIEELKYIWPK